MRLSPFCPAPSARGRARDSACGGPPRARSSRAFAISARKRGRSSRGIAADRASSARRLGDAGARAIARGRVLRAASTSRPCAQRSSRRRMGSGSTSRISLADVLELPLAAAPRGDRACRDDRVDQPLGQRGSRPRARRGASDRARPAPRPGPAARASPPCAGSSTARACRHPRRRGVGIESGPRIAPRAAALAFVGSGHRSGGNPGKRQRPGMRAGTLCYDSRAPACGLSQRGCRRADDVPANAIPKVRR